MLSIHLIKELGELMGMLFYLPEYDVFFQHITKCAGTSIEEYFIKHLNTEDQGVFELGNDRRHFQERNFERSITSIRNPFDRFVSSYKSFVRYGSLGEMMPDLDNILFPKYVDYIFNLDVEPDFDAMYYGKYFDDLPMHWNIVARIHTVPMTHSFYQADKFETIIRFENLLDDWNSALLKYEIPNDWPLSHHAKSPGKYYQEYYDTETRGLIAEYYKEDLLTFGYEF
jgi:hypothetical protein